MSEMEAVRAALGRSPTGIVVLAAYAGHGFAEGVAASLGAAEDAVGGAAGAVGDALVDDYWVGLVGRDCCCCCALGWVGFVK